jgi:hypothetical protein
MTFSRLLPSDNEEVRRSLYRGAIYQLAPTPASQRLVSDVLALLEGELGKGGPLREAQFRLSGEDFFRCVGRLRKVLYLEGRFHEAVRALMAEIGFAPPENAFDPLRLRVITHAGRDNPKAAPIYYTHRDTWYSNPQAQVSWWLPLHDVCEEETFVFYPDFFERAVPNESGLFNYDDWIRDKRELKIGWQNPDAGRQSLYPSAPEPEEPGTVRHFSCRAGEILFFAGAHLHQTRGHHSGRTRFSVDFRTVHLGDYQRGLGAPNVDNRSTGSALQDYLHPNQAVWKGGMSL